MRGIRGSARSPRWSFVLAAGLSLLLVGTSCSSDKTNTATASTDAAATSEADLGPAKPATGDTVKVGFISASEGDSPLTANFKRTEAGMKMAVDYVNDYRNGFGGHKVELVVCQGGETPAGSQDCANQLVNEGVVAVVEPLTSQGASMVPVLTNAEIPFIGLSGASQEELLTKGSYIFSGGLPVLFTAMADHASQQGFEHVSMLVTDGPGVVAGVSAFAKPAFEKKGIQFDAIPVAVGTPDMTPQLQTAVNSGADAIATLGDATFCASFLQGYQTLGLTLPKYLLGTCSDPTVTSAYPDLVEGSFGAAGSATDASDPDVKAFSAMAAKYSDGAVNPDPTSTLR